jgi:cysteinyl-tRNA synthetase
MSNRSSSFQFWLAGALLLAVTACNLPIGGVSPTGPRLTFLNISEGQTLSGTVARAPGVTVVGGNASQIRLEVLRADGSLDWERLETETPACITGDTNGLCNNFNTTQRGNGNYRVRATATLTNGQVLTGEIGFRINNGGPTPPAPPSPPSPPTPPSPPPPPQPATKLAWQSVDSWGIQYHGFNSNTDTAVNTLDAVNVDVLVLGRFDGVGREWAASDMTRLAQKKWVFSYLSIGQAQTIEWYWQSGWRVGNPNWLLSQWDYPGTYNVAFWDTQWQNIMFQSIDHIIANGFDGVFFDQSDPWWNTNFPRGGKSVQELMGLSRDLVCNIANYARNKKPGFKIMVNGGGNQIEFGSSYWNCLDAVAGEHMWYSGNGNLRESGYRDYTIPQLQKLLPVGKKVFTFDYTSVQSEINYVLTTSRNLGFIPTLTDTSISSTPRTF